MTHQLKLYKAIAFATIKHGDQKRKYSYLPYITHCLEVAKLLHVYEELPHLEIAAILHDTLEDTSTTKDELVDNFGLRIANIVVELTDHYTDTVKWGNRQRRKELEAKRLATVSDEAKIVKLADMIDNTKSIVTFDPNFAKTYLKEKWNLVKMITVDSPLWGMAYDSCMENMDLLGVKHD